MTENNEKPKFLKCFSKNYFTLIASANSEKYAERYQEILSEIYVGEAQMVLEFMTWLDSNEGVGIGRGNYRKRYRQYVKVATKYGIEECLGKLK
tara:strand:- start:175 stop:456 length:282 start_codon:yes stop_codon:yes gene_type:complete